MAIPIKNFFRHLYSRFKTYSRPKKISLLFGGAATVLAAYLLVSLLAVSPTELRLAALKESWEGEPICREKCQAARREAAAAVASSLERRPDSRLARRLKNYFFDPTLSREFKAETIRLWREAAGPDKPPDYFRTYLDSADADPWLAARIIGAFNPADQTPLDYYFSLLDSQRDDIIKREAIRAISDYPDQAQAFSAVQLALIRNLILAESTGNTVRQALVLLLSDYHPIFPDESAEILRAIYRSSTADEISRAFAADFLNRSQPGGGAEGEVSWPLPEISAAAWEEYYND